VPNNFTPTPFVFGLQDRNQIALTFDDGPDDIYTAQILTLLKEYDAMASFFVVGQNVERRTSVVLETARLGHTICNHTFSHPDLASRTAEQIRIELSTCANAIHKAVGGFKANGQYFRAPYGSMGGAVLDVARGIGLTGVYWSANSEDYGQDPADSPKPMPPDAILSRVCAAVESNSHGSIVLMHDGHPKSEAHMSWRRDRSATVMATKMLLEKYSGLREFVALGADVGVIRAILQ
jgi:peptidoglycan/xylan/chitin deacetylase (PgdA/CDA1 family)